MEIAAVDNVTRNKLVVFPFEGPSLEIWDWDGTSATFNDRTPAALPAGWPDGTGNPYFSAYDPTHKMAVLFGDADIDKNNTLSPATATIEYEPASGKLTPVAYENPPLSWPQPGDVLQMFHDSTLGGVMLDSGFQLSIWDPAQKTWKKSTAVATPPSSVDIFGVRAHDTQRRKLYSFVASGTAIKISELDIATGTWSAHAPASCPDGTNLWDATYDPTRDRVVLTTVDTSSVAATFEWDPVSGIAKEIPAANPSDLPSSFVTSTGVSTNLFDKGSGHVTELIIPDRKSADDTYLGQVLTWDGAKWTRQRGAHLQLPWLDPPNIDYPLSLAYDPAAQRSVSFAVSRAGEPMGSTLDWDGKAWSDITSSDPKQSPPVRDTTAMTYDASRKRIVLFGGVGSDFSRFNDLWECDVATGQWTNRTPNPLPAEWPTDGPAALVYDPATKMVLLVNNDAESTWGWDDATGKMTRLVVGAYPYEPLGADTWSLVYDARRKLPVLIDSESRLHLWTFDRTQMEWARIEPAQGSQFPIIAARASAYDPVRDEIVVAGSDAIWAFNLSTSTWSNQTPAPLPAWWPDTNVIEPMNGADYDSARGRFVLLLSNGTTVERPSK